MWVTISLGNRWGRDTKNPKLRHSAPSASTRHTFTIKAIMGWVGYDFAIRIWRSAYICILSNVGLLMYPLNNIELIRWLNSGIVVVYIFRRYSTAVRYRYPDPKEYGQHKPNTPKWPRGAMRSIHTRFRTSPRSCIPSKSITDFSAETAFVSAFLLPGIRQPSFWCHFSTYRLPHVCSIGCVFFGYPIFDGFFPTL